MKFYRQNLLAFPATIALGLFASCTPSDPGEGTAGGGFRGGGEDRPTQGDSDAQKDSGAGSAQGTGSATSDGSSSEPLGGKTSSGGGTPTGGGAVMGAGTNPGNTNRTASDPVTNTSGNQSSAPGGGTFTGTAPGGSTPGNKCERGFSLIADGFGLTQAADLGIDQAMLPESVEVKITKGSDHRICTGVIYNSQQIVGAVNDKGEGVSSDVQYALFPRISLAKHCLANVTITSEGVTGSKDSARISEIAVSFGEGGSRTSESILFSKNGESTYKDGKPSPWFIPNATIETARADGACSAASEYACFSAAQDRYDLITKAEISAKAEANKAYPGEGINFAATKETYAKLKAGVLSHYESPLHELFDRSNARYIPPIEQLDFNRVLAIGFNPTSDAQTAQLLNKHLYGITVISLIHNGTIAPVYYIKRPADGWTDAAGGSGVLKIYSGQDGGRYQIEAIALNDITYPLSKGHSGTILMGHWLSVKRPVATVLRFRGLLGVLSTVNGEPVCTGSDLNCCDKI